MTSNLSSDSDDVTGGTTISIKYLKDWGYIKPIPPKEKLKSMLQDGKEVILHQKGHLTDLYQKEKDTLLTDKKHFFRYFWPRVVKPPDDKKKLGKKWYVVYKAEVFSRFISTIHVLLLPVYWNSCYFVKKYIQFLFMKMGNQIKHVAQLRKE